MSAMSGGSPDMDKATDLSNADRAKTSSSQHDNPVIYCEKCAKTPEEIGGNLKFMVCSKCKSQLNIAVYYCSP